MAELPPFPNDPAFNGRWYQAVRDALEDRTLIEEGKKRHRGRTEKTANYTLNSNDAGKAIILSGSTGRTFTIDASTVGQNDQGFFRQEGTGQITIAGASGTSLRINGDFNSKTRGQYARVDWERISTTEIILTGQLEPIVTLSFFASNTSTAETITIPAGAATGDVMVLVQRAKGASAAPSDVTPSGWTDVGATVNVFQEGAVDVRVSHKYKIATSSDAGATVTGMNGGDRDHKIILVFRPTDAASAVAPQDLAGEIVSGDPSAQICNASSGATPLLVIASFGEGGGQQTGVSFSPSEDGIVTNIDIDAYFKIYNSSPADVSLDLGDGGTGNSLCSFYLEVS